MTISAALNAKKSTVTESNVAAAGFDIPSAPQVMQLRSKDFFKIFPASLHHLYPNSRILLEANSGFFAPEGRKIRLFCCHWKVCVLQGNTPFPVSAVAEGITH